MLTQRELRRRMAAYEKNATDGAAANALNMTYAQYHMWRVYAGLKAKAKVGRPKLR